MVAAARRSFKRHLLTGLIAIAPITVTALVLWWIFQQLDGLLGRLIYPLIGVPIPGLGLLALILLLVTVGWAAERTVGGRILAWWHNLLERFPLTRGVYGASNRIVKTVFGREKKVIGQVVLVEYPSAGRWSVGFMTAATPMVAEHIDDPVSVFVATTPNPTSGWVVVVPRSQVIPLAMTVEQAFTWILSAGAVGPDAPVPVVPDTAAVPVPPRQE